MQHVTGNTSRLNQSQSAIIEILCAMDSFARKCDFKDIILLCNVLRRRYDLFIYETYNHGFNIECCPNVLKFQFYERW